MHIYCTVVAVIPLSNYGKLKSFFLGGGAGTGTTDAAFNSLSLNFGSLKQHGKQLHRPFCIIG